MMDRARMRSPSNLPTNGKAYGWVSRVTVLSVTVVNQSVARPGPASSAM